MIIKHRDNGEEVSVILSKKECAALGIFLRAKGIYDDVIRELPPTARQGCVVSQDWGTRTVSRTTPSGQVTFETWAWKDIREVKKGSKARLGALLQLVLSHSPSLKCSAGWTTTTCPTVSQRERMPNFVLFTLADAAYDGSFGDIEVMQDTTLDAVRERAAEFVAAGNGRERYESRSYAIIEGTIVEDMRDEGT